MTTLRRRTGPLAVLVTVALAVAVGCNPDPNADQESASEKGNRAFSLTVARTADVDTLDPSQATAFQTVQTLELIYDRLLATDDDGELVPELAEKWNVSDGGKTLTFRLQRGVKFHDGSDFTSSDAKATLERNLDEETASVVASYLGNIDEVQDPEPHKLVLKLAQPDAGLLTALTMTGNSILSEEDIESGNLGKKGAEPNGTGPFEWTTWEQNQRLQLDRNDDYWNGPAQAKGLDFRVIPDESSIVSGMEAGNFDLGLVSDPAVARQADSKKVRQLSEPTLSYHTLQLNSTEGPLQSKEARQAIACAVDRQDIIDSVYFGDAQETGPINSPAYPYHPTDDLPCKPGDLDAARDLLAAAGYPDGFSLHTIVMTGSYSTATNIAQSLKAQLSKIGVELELDRQPADSYVTSWSEADHDAALALNGGSTDPYLMYNRYFTTDGSLATAAAYQSEELNDLLQQGNRTTNKQEREQIFDDLQATLLEDSPWVWLFNNQMHYLTRPDLRSFVPMPTESLEKLRFAFVS